MQEGSPAMHWILAVDRHHPLHHRDHYCHPHDHQHDYHHDCQNNNDHEIIITILFVIIQEATLNVTMTELSM